MPQAGQIKSKSKEMAGYAGSEAVRSLCQGLALLSERYGNSGEESTGSDEADQHGRAAEILPDTLCSGWKFL